MKNFMLFEKYHHYGVAFTYIMYAICDIYFKPFGEKGSVWNEYSTQIISLLFFFIYVLSGSIIRRVTSRVKENNFLDSLQSDLMSDNNPLFIQIRQNKVPYLHENILKSISHAINSKTWWDFSYLAIKKEIIEEIKSSFSDVNKAASLTVFKDFPLDANYIFVGTIQNNSNIGFPETVILNPGEKSDYRLEFDRLYVYKKSKSFFSSKEKYSFKLIQKNVLIKEQFHDIMGKLNKNIDENNSYHVHWDVNGGATYTKSIKNFNNFMNELENNSI